MPKKLLVEDTDNLLGVYAALTMGLGVFGDSPQRREMKVWTWQEPEKCNCPRHEDVKARKKKKHHKKMLRKKKRGY